MIPAFAIEADGIDVTGRLDHRLISLRLTDKPAMEADEVELVVTDHDRALQLPRIGATLKVSIGWHRQALIDKGTYQVDEVAHEGPPDTITVRARAAEFGGPLKEQREESYDGQTLGDILTTVAERLRLKPAIEAGLASIVIDHIDQTTESDANFLTRLGQDYDAVATIKAGHLLFMPVGHPTTIGGTALAAVQIHRGDGDRHSFTVADRDGSVKGVKAQWRDLEAARTRFALAGEEPEDGVDGTDGTVKMLKRMYPTEAEAMKAAKSELQRLARAKREIRLTLATGRPELIANGRMALAGFRPEIDKLTWLVGEVTHTIADSGFMTELSAQAL